MVKAPSLQYSTVRYGVQYGLIFYFDAIHLNPNNFPLHNLTPLTMDAQIPKHLYQALASIGLVYVTAKLLSVLQFIASTFLLPGIPVGSLNNQVHLQY